MHRVEIGKNTNGESIAIVILFLFVKAMVFSRHITAWSRVLYGFSCDLFLTVLMYLSFDVNM